MSGLMDDDTLTMHIMFVSDGFRIARPLIFLFGKNRKLSVKDYFKLFLQSKKKKKRRRRRRKFDNNQRRNFRLGMKPLQQLTSTGDTSRNRRRKRRFTHNHIVVGGRQVGVWSKSFARRSKSASCRLLADEVKHGHWRVSGTVSSLSISACSPDKRPAVPLAAC